MLRFRYNPKINISYDRQGYIYFTSKMYKNLPQKRKQEIWSLCKECGGAYAAALLKFVTTDLSQTAVCMSHNLSSSTLRRSVRRYYESFPAVL